MTRISGLNDSGVVMRGNYVEVPHEVYLETDIDCQLADDGMTRQEFADECDINVLMQRYEKSGVISHINRAPPEYLDLSDLPDLQEALAAVDAAQTAFMTLPASVRREFDNDPVQFAEFASNPKNLERMREWGLAPPARVPDAPIEVRVVNEPLDPAAAPAAPKSPAA